MHVGDRSLFVSWRKKAQWSERRSREKGVCAKREPEEDRAHPHADTSLAGVPVFPVAAMTGDGINGLKQHLLDAKNRLSLLMILFYHLEKEHSMFTIFLMTLVGCGEKQQTNDTSQSTDTNDTTDSSTPNDCPSLTEQECAASTSCFSLILSAILLII